MQTRYFHIRSVISPKGGATVVVSPSEVPYYVNVQHAECSCKDNYDKRKGRSLAAKAEGVNIPLRYLPEKLTEIAKGAKRHGRVAIVKTNFDYAIKYFLPKE